MNLLRLAIPLIALALAACSDKPVTPAKPSTLEPGRAQLEDLRATAVTIHRVDPRSESSERSGLAAWKVLESKAVDSPQVRERIIAILLKDETYADRGAKCFDPRDAVTFKNAEGRTIDVVICFECSWIYFYDGAKHLKTLSFSEKGETELSKLLHEILPPVNKE